MRRREFIKAGIFLAALPSMSISKQNRIENAKTPIQVRDVVASVPVSARYLQQRFRAILGRSIHEEIKRVHLEQMIGMLVETDMSVSEIASALGYYSFKNIARYFRRQKGMTPLAYRKKYGHI